MIPEALEEFCLLVLREQHLQDQLRQAPDQHAFIERMLVLGAAYGYAFSADEIEAKLRSARRAWLERWSTR